MKYSFGVNRKKYGEIIVENRRMSVIMKNSSDITRDRPGITRPGMKIDKVEG